MGLFLAWLNVLCAVFNVAMAVALWGEGNPFGMFIVVAVFNSSVAAMLFAVE